MSERRRLHPVTILFTAVKTVKEAIIPIAAVIFAAFKDGFGLYETLFIAVSLIILLTFSISSWYRFTYRVTDDELRIEYGIFVRKKRYISKHRIQSIDLTAGVLHRMLRLVQVKIETAGSGEGADASIKAVGLPECEQLRTELKTAAASCLEEDAPAIATPKRKITRRELLVAGSTSGSAGVLLAVLVFGFFKVEQFIPAHIYDSTLAWVISLSIAFIVMLAVVLIALLWLLGIAGTVIKYGRFTITQNGDELFLTRGLLEKKQITIPLKKIQAVGTEESMIRQPFGYVTVFAEVAGNTLEKGETFSNVLFPVMKANEVEDFLQRFVPDYSGHLTEMQSLPRRAAAYYLLRTMLLFVIIFAVTAYFLPQFIWVALILLAASAGLGFLRYKDAGYHWGESCLTLRTRRWSRQTVMIYNRRIQAFERKQHRVQRVQRLASVVLSIVGIGGSGRHFELRHMDETEADRLADWYSFRVKK